MTNVVSGEISTPFSVAKRLLLGIGTSAPLSALESDDHRRYGAQAQRFCGQEDDCVGSGPAAIVESHARQGSLSCQGRKGLWRDYAQWCRGLRVRWALGLLGVDAVVALHSLLFLVCTLFMPSPVSPLVSSFAITDYSPTTPTSPLSPAGTAGLNTMANSS